MASGAGDASGQQHDGEGDDDECAEQLDPPPRHRPEAIDEQVQPEVGTAADRHRGAQEDHPHEAEPRDLVIPLKRRVHHVAAPDAEKDVGDQHRHEPDADELDEHGYFAAAFASATTRSKSSLPTFVSMNFHTGCARSWKGRRSFTSLTCMPLAFIWARPSVSARTSSWRC